MTFVYLAVVLIVVLVVFESVRLIHLYSRVKRYERITKLVEQDIPGANHTVMVVGDSITYGVGVTDSKDSLAGKLIEYFPESRVVNISQPGASVQKIEQLIDQNAERIRNADISVISMGGIDMVTFANVKRSAAAASRIIDKVKKNTKGKVIWVFPEDVSRVPMFRFPVNKLLKRKVNELHKAYKKIANDQNVLHVDLIERDRVHEMPHTHGYAKDGIHPDEARYRAWFERIQKHL